MVGKLRHFKKIGRNARHQVTGAVRVEKAERFFFYVCEQVAPHVRFNARTKNVAPVADEPVRDGMQHIHEYHARYHDEQRAWLHVGDELVERVAAQHRESGVNCGNDERAEHVAGEQFPVRFIVRKENGK